MSNVRITRSDELIHHGIKGQKWGIRRYQDENGTLTAEGKKRYGFNSPYRTAVKINNDYAEVIKQGNRERKERRTELKRQRNLREISKEEYKQGKKDLKSEAKQFEREAVEGKSKALAQSTTRGKSLATGILTGIGSITMASISGAASASDNMMVSAITGVLAGTLGGVSTAVLANEHEANKYR